MEDFVSNFVDIVLGVGCVGERLTNGALLSQNHLLSSVNIIHTVFTLFYL